MVSCLCLAVFSLLFSPSSASASTFIESPSQSYGFDLDKTVLTYSDGTSSKCQRLENYGAIFQCNVKANSLVNGVDIVTSRDVNSNVMLNFNIVLSGFALMEDFKGFHTGESGYNIESQTQVYNVSYGQTIVQLSMYNGDFGARSYFRLQTVMVANTDPQYIYITPFNGSGRLDATWFSNSIGSIQSDLSTIKSLTQAIKDGGIVAKVDQSGTISAINSASQAQVNATNANTTAVNNAANQAHKDSQAQIDSQNKTTEAINNQAKQDQEQYEQDKQEEQDRENQGNEDADKAAGIFDFNLLNPFGALFEFFIGSQNCASIPTLARWVHSDTSTVCSWWSADVISVLTPVFGISSIILLFGFFIKWLRGSDFIDVELLK